MPITWFCNLGPAHENWAVCVFCLHLNTLYHKHNSCTLVIYFSAQSCSKNVDIPLTSLKFSSHSCNDRQYVYAWDWLSGIGSIKEWGVPDILVDAVYLLWTVQYAQTSLPTTCTIFLYLLYTTPTCFGHISWPLPESYKFGRHVQLICQLYRAAGWWWGVCVLQ